MDYTSIILDQFQEEWDNPKQLPWRTPEPNIRVLQLNQDVVLRKSKKIVNVIKSENYERTI